MAIKRVFLLGRGIKNSLSPIMQNAAFELLGINAHYDLEDLEGRKLENFFSNLQLENLLGFNVTSPFKEDVVDYLSSIDSRSKSIGAVNTVKVTSNLELKGFNTDYDGIVASLEKLGVLGRSSKTKGALIVGAGGAARACIFALLSKGYSSITILNRTISRAADLSKQFTSLFPKSHFKIASLSAKNLRKSLEFPSSPALIINAVSRSTLNYFPVKLDFSEVNEETKAFDLGYKEESLFLSQARNNGLQAIDGFLMLIVQAAKSFEIWTGRKAPIEVMTSAAKKCTISQRG